MRICQEENLNLFHHQDILIRLYVMWQLVINVVVKLRLLLVKVEELVVIRDLVRFIVDTYDRTYLPCFVVMRSCGMFLPSG